MTATEFNPGIDPDTVALVREQAARRIGPQILNNATDYGPQDCDMEWVNEITVEDEFVRAMRDVRQLP